MVVRTNRPRCIIYSGDSPKLNSLSCFMFHVPHCVHTAHPTLHQMLHSPIPDRHPFDPRQPALRYKVFDIMPCLYYQPPLQRLEAYFEFAVMIFHEKCLPYTSRCCVQSQSRLRRLPKKQYPSFYTPHRTQTTTLDDNIGQNKQSRMSVSHQKPCTDLGVHFFFQLMEVDQNPTLTLDKISPFSSC
jgi:hypothetical protein